MSRLHVVSQRHYRNGHTEPQRELVFGRKEKKMVKLGGVKFFLPCNGVEGKWHCANYTLRQKPSSGTSLKQHFIMRIRV